MFIRTGLPLLVVEDNAELRELLVEFFDGSGFAVVGKRDGLAALEALDPLPRPCLIVLDLMMPRMSGSEFLTRLAERADAEDFAVVVTSTFRLPPELERLPIVLGYLEKPIDLSELEALVARWRERIAGGESQTGS